MQVVTREEALYLGFVDDIMNLPKGKEITSVERINGDDYAVIINEDGIIIKQMITKKEAERIEAQLQREKNQDPQEADNDGVPMPGEADLVGNSAEAERSDAFLPKTATNVVDLLFIGGVLFIIGLIIYYGSRPKLTEGKSLKG